MMTNTTLLEEETVSGDAASDSVKFESLFGCLTAREREQVRSLLDSLSGERI